MLPRGKRVPRSLFAKAMGKSSTVSGEHFNLRFHKDGSSNPGRFSFVISGKVAPLAVKRNQLRRQGYAALKELSPKAEGIIAVFVAKKGTATLSYQGLLTEISKLLKEARFS